MKSIKTYISIAAALAISVPMLGACSLINDGTRASTCEAPPDERQLVKEYKRDRMITSLPPHAKDARQINTERACIDPGDDGGPTKAEAWRAFILESSEDIQTAVTHYNTLGKSLGWKPVADTKIGPELTLCRSESDFSTFFELRVGHQSSLGTEAIAAVYADTERQC